MLAMQGWERVIDILFRLGESEDPSPTTTTNIKKEVKGKTVKKVACTLG